MPTYLNPQLTVERAGPVLEQEFRLRFGDEEYERLYRTISLNLQEHSTDQEQQVLGIITLIGKTTERITALGGFDKLLYTLACQSGLGRAEQVVVIGDGAHWIFAPMWHRRLCLKDEASLE